jgi:hypothetical protein
MVCGVKDFRVYGPVPTGFATVSVAGSLYVDQTCLGTTNVVSTLVWLTNWDEVKLTVTWLPLALMSPNGSAFWLRAGEPLMSWKVYATSSALIACPSDHFTLSRTVSTSFV